MVKTEYFYGAEAGNYTFYCLPSPLFTDEKLKDISDGAKILYSMMLSRVSLSEKNHWKDDQGRIYIIFTIEKIMEKVGCSKVKAVKMLAELDSKEGVGLIERIRRGHMQPDIIYVKKILSEDRSCIDEIFEPESSFEMTG